MIYFSLGDWPKAWGARASVIVRGAHLTCRCTIVVRKELHRRFHPSLRQDNFSKRTLPPHKKSFVSNKFDRRSENL